MRTLRTDALAQNTRTRLNAEQLEDRAVPAAAPNVTTFAVGADAGGGSHVNIFNADGTPRFSFEAFSGFNGSVRVATGDLNGDGTEDIVVAAGPVERLPLASDPFTSYPAMGGHVKVFDGATGNLLSSFFAFDNFAGGLNVAVGDVNQDTHNDIIVGTATGSSHVKAFDFASGATLRSFFAFNGYSGGVTLAAGNYDMIAGDDIVTGDEIIVGTATGASHVKVFGASQNLLASFIVNSDFSGGINVAAADLRGDGRAEIVVAGATGNGQVLMYEGGTGEFITSFDAGFTGTVHGLRIATGDVNNDAKPEILVAAGPGQNASVKAFNSLLTQMGSLVAFDGFSGGVFLG